jgi:SAM-dependent methyltransferase
VSEPFGAAYAGVYDVIYHDKDYTAECDLIEGLFQRHAPGPVRDILDLGCGTGGHAQILAERGHQVVGVDRSAAMIEIAREKAREGAGSSPPTYHRGDIREVRLDRRFDAVLMMFAVLGYQLEDDDVRASLHSARTHLRDGGILLLDCWYGPAVLYRKPTQRVKIVDGSSGRLTRVSVGELDAERNLCVVNFRIESENHSGVGRVEEAHRVRYFFAPELSRFLDEAGFSPLRIGAMPDFDRDPTEDTWNVLLAAITVERSTHMNTVVGRAQHVGCRAIP